MKIEDRFWAKVNKTATCWGWTACLNSNGYGMFKVAGRTVCAHRFAYELLVGPIPEGLVTDHLCRNRSCVNPGHLEPVTNAVNILRGVGVGATNALKTECFNGHPLSGENLYLYPGGERACRICIYARNRAWKRAKRAA